jgi:hypothetical protein
VSGPKERKPKPHALPLYSTDTREEAEGLKILVCTLVPQGFPLGGEHVLDHHMRGPDGFDGTLEGLERATQKVHEWHQRTRKRGDGGESKSRGTALRQDDHGAQRPYHEAGGAGA